MVEEVLTEGRRRAIHPAYGLLLVLFEDDAGLIWIGPDGLPCEPSKALLAIVDRPTFRLLLDECQRVSERLLC